MSRTILDSRCGCAFCFMPRVSGRFGADQCFWHASSDRQNETDSCLWMLYSIYCGTMYSKNNSADPCWKAVGDAEILWIPVEKTY